MSLLISRGMEPEGQPVAGSGLSGHRVRRALARRFPRTRWLYNWLRVQIPHYLRRLLALVSPKRLLATYRWLRTVSQEFTATRSEARLTVGVEVTAFWEPLTGIGWYLYRLLEGLADRDDVRLRLYGPTVIDSPDRVEPQVPLPSGTALEPVLHQIPDGLILPRGLLIRLARRLEPWLIAADANEVLFGPNYFLPRRFSFARGERVVTVHDLGFRTVPWTLAQDTLSELTAKLEHSVFEASRIITVSEAIKTELVAYRYSDADRVTAVHHGPGQLSNVTAGTLPPGLPEAFVLHVGTLEPRKNIGTLLETWRLLRRRRPDAPPLVFCGRFGWKAEAIRAEMDRAAREGWVIHLGYVSEGELAALYEKASLVAFPSLYEGFGLPAVEAFWAGTPLVASDIAALREVAGPAALYAPPDRPDLFADQVEAVLDQPETREALIQAGKARIRELSWESSAAQTVQVFRQAAGRPDVGGAH